MLQEETRIRQAYEKLRNKKSQRYSWFNMAYVFYAQELERALLGLLSKRGVRSFKGKSILDIGCGGGHWIREFVKLGAPPETLVGIDLRDSPIEAARRTCPASVRLEQRNAEKLEFADRSFDVITQFLMFSSILDSNMKQKVASEMLRVLKEDGFIIWYDFFVRDPRNNDVRGVTKREIYQLFPDCQIEFHRVSLAQPIVRSIAPYSWLFCYLLEKLKMFNTHYLALIRR